MAVKCDIFRPKNVIFKGVLDVVFNSCEAWLQCILTNGELMLTMKWYSIFLTKYAVWKICNRTYAPQWISNRSWVMFIVIEFERGDIYFTRY